MDDWCTAGSWEQIPPDFMEGSCEKCASIRAPTRLSGDSVSFGRWTEPVVGLSISADGRRLAFRTVLTQHSVYEGDLEGKRRVAAAGAPADLWPGTRRLSARVDAGQQSNLLRFQPKREMGDLQAEFGSGFRRAVFAGWQTMNLAPE